jgi:uncharacterized protein
MEIQTKQHRELVCLAILVEGGLLILAIILGSLFSLPLMENLYWDRFDVLIGAAVSLPMLVMFLAFERWPIKEITRIKVIFDANFLPALKTCTLFDLTWISLLAGVSEEMLFRGALQLGIGKLCSPAVGITASAAFFGLAHFMTAFYALIAGIIGVYLGIIFMCTGNLLSVIIAHFLYDLLALLYLVKWRR